VSRIAFNRVGTLPAPEGHEAPQVFLAPFHPVCMTNPRASLVVRDENDSQRELAYSFQPMKPEYWHDWSAAGWEDCEIGRCVLEATSPNGERFSWSVQFAHDGNPKLEFWGAYIDAPIPVNHPCLA